MQKIFIVLGSVCLLAFFSHSLQGKIKPPAKELFKTRQEFVVEMFPHAKKAARTLGLDPRVLVAQAAHETDWGKRLPRANGCSSLNLFGIKSYNKKNAAVTSTTEYVKAKRIKIKAGFKIYNSYEDSFLDYARLISSSKRYGIALNNTKDPLQYLQALQKAGYATDPLYAKKIYEKFQLKTIQNLG